MATGSGAFPAKAGFNQSGGGYLMVMNTGTTLTNSLLTYGGASGSGGAYAIAAFAAAGAADLPGGTSTLFANGKIVRDMGKTIVSAGRSFRKIQAQNPAVSNVAPSAYTGSFGIAGLPAGSPTANAAGYATFYVELARDGQGASPGAQLVRFM